MASTDSTSEAATDRHPAELNLALRSLRTWASMAALALLVYFIANVRLAFTLGVNEEELATQGPNLGALALALVVLVLVVGFPFIFAILTARCANKAASSDNFRSIVQALIWSRRFMVACAVWLVTQSALLAIIFALGLWT
jgi:hypothetical protein